MAASSSGKKPVSGQGKKQASGKAKKQAAPQRPKSEAAIRYQQAEEKRLKRNNQLFAILLFAAGVFFGCVSLLDGPKLWGFLHDMLRGICGVISYGIGPLMIYMAVMITLEKEHREVHNRFWQMMILLVLLCGIAQIPVGEPEGETFFAQISALYTEGVELKGGGLLAGILCWPLLVLMGKTGTVIVHILLTFVFLMLVSGSTLIGFLKGIFSPGTKLWRAGSNAWKNRDRTPVQKPARPRKDTPVLPEADGEYRELPDASLFAVKDKNTPQKPDRSSSEAFASAIDRFRESPGEASAEKKNSYLDELIEKSQAAPKTSSRLEIPKQPEAEPVPAQNTEDVPLNEMISRAIDAFEKEPAPAAEAAPEVPAPAPAVQDAPVQDGKTPGTDAQVQPYRYPTVDLLREPPASAGNDVSEELRANAEKLVNTLKSFGVQTKIVDICRGPTVTRYELQPSAGVKISKITGLADDIALNLATAGVRIEAPIPNKSAVGIEVPNRVIDMVSIREMIDSEEFRTAKGTLPAVLGRDIAGSVTIADIAAMPHVLIAGTTGSGKSVCVNSIIISLLYKFPPEELRFMMIDPKMVELVVYNGIPHLLVPVVTDPRKAAGALGWAVNEMLRRYNAFSENGVRDIKGFNKLCASKPELQKMPHVVIVIDELSDLMMAAPNEVEDAICRLAQMARAAGMYLIIATQRPSVDVVTGLIKANIPSRIALTVSSQIDSRTILDSAGAEKLLGRGDMLYHPVGLPKPVRVQGCFVSDGEVEAVVRYIRDTQTEEVKYDSSIQDEIDRQAAAEPAKKGASASGDDGSDPLFMDAVEELLDAGQASTSYLQRRLKVGYARAARIMDELEDRGIVGPQEGSKPRELQITRAQWQEIRERMAD